MGQAHYRWLCPALARYLTDGSTTGDRAAGSHCGAFFGAVISLGKEGGEYVHADSARRIPLPVREAAKAGH